MTLTCWLQCIRSEWTLALQTICRLHNENLSNFQTYRWHCIWTNQKSCCLLKYWPSAMSTYEKISAQLLLSVRCSSRVVASTQSFKYQYLSLKYQYQYFGSKYQYHCTSTCSQYHAAASYRLVQNLKSTTKHNITYSRIYNNALQLTVDQTESDNHHTQINNLFSIFRQTV